MNRKYLIFLVLIIILVIGVIILISFLSAPADKITGNLILGKFDSKEYKLNTVGEVVKNG